MNLDLSLTWLSGVAFLIYGLLIIFTSHMIEEFDRYGMTKFRKLTGILEILGGLGSLIGLKFYPIYLVSTLGLFLLMLMGVITRLRIKDEFSKILPALSLMTINGYLFVSAILVL